MLEIFQTELDTGHIGKTLENISLSLLELDNLQNEYTKELLTKHISSMNHKTWKSTNW